MDALHEITEQLTALRGGDDPEGWEQLAPLVYAELRAIAHRQLHRERDGHTLNTTALVHEAYLKLADQRHTRWRSRTHFFSMAATVMRRVLVDYARSYKAAKRAGALDNLSLEPSVALDDGRAGVEWIAIADERAEVLIALDDALDRLASIDKRLARVVECRFFGGLTEEETASALGMTARTVRRDWVRARAWLRNAIEV
jgi:RNA polymerase sigma factor (TIGR02999 family)